MRSDLLLFFEDEISQEPLFGPVSLRGCRTSSPDSNELSIRITFSEHAGSTGSISFLDLEFNTVDDVNQLKRACKKVSTPIQLSDFQPLACIGRGKWGKVSVCRRELVPDDQTLYAVKEVKLRNRRTIKLIQDERIILSLMEPHPFIVQLHYAIKKGAHVYFIMDFMPGGDLYTMLRRFNIKLADTLFYAAEIALALEHCHKQRIVHRDLKPENVLVDQEGHVKLADFGLAKILPQGCEGTKTLCGTEVYAAPEMLQRSIYGFSVDFWQFGCFVYELFAGHSPFYADAHSNGGGEAKLTSRDLILGGTYTMPDYVPKSPKKFISQLLALDPHERLGCSPNALASNQPAAGWELVKAHSFFKDAPWDAVIKRRVQPPVVNVEGGMDVLENFEDQFIDEDPDFICQEDATTPCDEMLVGFYYPGF
ncbi:unnamed protein product [Heterosigma akashiwo]